MLELKLLVEQLRVADTDGEFTLNLYSHPADRFPFLRHTISRILVDSVNNLLARKDPLTLAMHEATVLYETKYTQMLNLLYDRWWTYCYPVHEVHFHKSFEEFCSCPFTCLTEITDVIEKITYGEN